jgi:cation transporter-like permease
MLYRKSAVGSFGRAATRVRNMSKSDAMSFGFSRGFFVGGSVGLFIGLTIAVYAYSKHLEPDEIHYPQSTTPSRGSNLNPHP